MREPRGCSRGANAENVRSHPSWISGARRILEAVGPENERDAYTRFREALEHGYEGEYDTIAQNAYEKGLSADECREVVDALQVYDMLHISYAALPAADRAAIKDYDIRFRGFDGNNETLFMAYAEFFCGDDGVGEERDAWAARHVDRAIIRVPPRPSP